MARVVISLYWKVSPLRGLGLLLSRTQRLRTGLTRFAPPALFGRLLELGNSASTRNLF
jgi:hypothetical protein